MKDEYQPAEIEAEAQSYWTEQRSFEVKEDLNREKFYCLSMLPYPSGELHMGHVRNYTIGDVISRYQHMNGKNVLQPMGWDAFGLPAENAAIERKLPPAEWTHKNIKKMKKQLQQLGYAFDWKREFATCDPSYYRWEQWLFIQLYKKGLVYRKNALVNWDPVDQTVLANEQVVDGKGWRSGAPVERREIPQWFFKITDYAEELLSNLDKMTEWPEQVCHMQRNWIGRSEGIEITFDVARPKSKITIFTTRADTLMGVTYIAIAPEHPIAQKVAEKNEDIAKFIKKCKRSSIAEADIATQEKLGINTGLKATHPVTEEKLPIWITNFVLMEYGSGAVMSVPAHDERDFEFAQKYDLPIQQVIEPPKSEKWDFNKAAYTEDGTLIHSGKFDGLKSQKAIKQIGEYLTKNKHGEFTVNYRLRDWGISRQRYWGTPIPIIYCKDCGDQPVPEEALPVVLPEDLIPDGHGSPLKSTPDFYKTKCPKCNKAAKRETDTMDTFVESSWYYARYACYDQDNAMLDDRAKYWTPVDQYVGGVEHAVMHLLYARFMHKTLRDLNLLNSDEPFTRLLTQGMVLKDGTKMSKSKGNIVPPQPLIKKYGSDTVRLFAIFAAPPEQTLEWSDSGVEGAYRFLNKLWAFCYKIKTQVQKLNEQPPETCRDLEDPALQHIHQSIHQILKQANQDMERIQLNTVVSAGMKLLNLFSKIDLNSDNQIHWLLVHEGISVLLRLLSPITPHITHYLWRELNFGKDILLAPWPKVNSRALKTSSVELVVQINGKLRAKITVPVDTNNDDLQTIALKDTKIRTHVGDKNIKKVIVIPNRLVNIVI